MDLITIDRMRVKRLPRVLALHLKRFKYIESANAFRKLSHRVAFPLDLRLFNTVCDRPTVASYTHVIRSMTLRRRCLTCLQSWCTWAVS